MYVYNVLKQFSNINILVHPIIENISRILACILRSLLTDNCLHYSVLPQAQGELLVEHMQNTGEVVLASTSPEGQTLIRNEIRALTESFHNLFNGKSSHILLSH